MPSVLFDCENLKPCMRQFCPVFSALFAGFSAALLAAGCLAGEAAEQVTDTQASSAPAGSESKAFFEIIMPSDAYKY
ncbi:MAG TPA: hypothetical protein PK347_02640 [Burkholderiaceae bacterium]|nr:hypothetical protein [Burkholderiaceae bacterium]